MRPRVQLSFVVFIAVFLFLPAAYAQKGAIDASVGFGAAQARALSSGISTSTLLPCTLSTDQSCITTPSLSSFMMGFDGTYMLSNRFGVGGEMTFQPARQDYLAVSDASTSGYGEKIQSRITFYDFNAVYRPISNKKASLQLSGGLGGASIKYYDVVSSSIGLLGSSTSASDIGSVNKFQLHGGVGVQIYLKGNVFIRPQFDLHYVPNLDRYGTNLVKRETIWVGYSFGR